MRSYRLTGAALGLASALLAVGLGFLWHFECPGLPFAATARTWTGFWIDPERIARRQALRATGGDGSHMTVEDAVSAQFAADIPAFAKPTFERFRRTWHSAQYFDPFAAPITAADASWAIEKATAALSGAKALLAASPPERFS